MLELPEAHTMAAHVRSELKGKTVVGAVTAHSPHKWAWFFGDPAEYHGRLAGRVIEDARGAGGLVQVEMDGVVLLFGDGVSARLCMPGEPRPARHQLLVEFDDGCALAASVQMYGGLWCFPEGAFDNPYYKAALEKPSPLTDAFDEHWFAGIVAPARSQRLSAKGLLATEQRIPGLGNGVLQDILYDAGIHPKRKADTFSGTEEAALFRSVKGVLAEMTRLGGRDTERDLFGKPGGYITKLSRNTSGKPCPQCGQLIRKDAYLGGSIYYCPGCQPLQSS